LPLKQKIPRNYFINFWEKTSPTHVGNRAFRKKIQRCLFHFTSLLTRTQGDGEKKFIFEVISKVFQKMAKMASQKAVKYSIQLLSV
jgi:hypothetical protein